MPNETTENYRRKRIVNPSACDPKSFRVKKLKGGKLLTICCPRGQWNEKRGRCKVGTKGQSVATPKRGMEASPLSEIKSVRIVKEA